MWQFFGTADFWFQSIQTGSRSFWPWLVVGSVIACGGCWYCRTEQYSLCDNSNPQPVLPEKLWGHTPAGIFGYSHAAGGFSGSHAEYVRVPFADIGAFPIPEQLADDTAVFASDAVPTGWMAADMCQLRGGEVVAVWGAGAVGQMAARAAQLLGAGRVIVIDRFQERLTMAAERIRCRNPGLLNRRRHGRVARDDSRARARRVYRGGRHGGTRQRHRRRL